MSYRPRNTRLGSRRDLRINDYIFICRRGDFTCASNTGYTIFDGIGRSVVGTVLLLHKFSAVFKDYVSFSLVFHDVSDKVYNLDWYYKLRVCPMGYFGKTMEMEKSAVVSFYLKLIFRKCI